MLKDLRTKEILGLLTRQSAVTVKDLSERFGVSEMTLRRDLEELESHGLLRRVRGGAVLASQRDPGFWKREMQQPSAKRLIGITAAAIVNDGQTVYIDAGSTGLQCAKALAQRCHKEELAVRVVTHAINVGMELATCPSLTLHQIGGQIDPSTLAATGLSAIEEIRQMAFDHFFMGVTGIDLKDGWTNSSPTGVEIKRAVSERTRSVWAVADLSKWNSVSFFRIMELTDVDGWIVEQSPGPDIEREFEAQGVSVLSAHPQPGSPGSGSQDATEPDDDIAAHTP